MKNPDCRFGTFTGVFLPSILTIIGVVMFLRLGNLVGKLGIGWTLAILLAAESIAVATGLSISSLSTNTPVKSGGPYFIISRALGPGLGASIGLTYFISQALSTPFYIIGFSEAVQAVFPSAVPYYSLYIALIPLAVLTAIAIPGAEWAVRAQLVIMIVLALSIFVILAGAVSSPPSVDLLYKNFRAAAGQHIDIITLAYFFAVFFPAVTGFLSGVNMSGELRDAGKSIPRGTMIAIAVGMLIYTAEVLLFGSAWPREELTENCYRTLYQHAWLGSGIMVFAGMSAATLSSALGTIVGAPRILQALASDGIIKPLNFFAPGAGWRRKPVIALIFTALISAVVILWSESAGGNALNLVAVLVTMFTLCTYAMINIAAFVESFAANPSFRPHFRFFHWSVGLYGAATSIIAALLIDAGVFLLASAATLLLFLFMRGRRGSRSFSDARRGFCFERIRRDLLALAAMPEDAKNWRPRISVLSGDIRRHRRLIEYAELLNNSRGIVSAVNIVEHRGESGDAVRSRELRKMLDFSRESRCPFFPAVAVTSGEDFDVALNVFLQAHSIGPLVPNIIMTGWPSASERVKAFFGHLRTVEQLHMSGLVMIDSAAGLRRAAGSSGRTIDVWWRGRRNGQLMLILAYLLQCNSGWRDCRLRLLRISDASSVETGRRELLHLAEEARIAVDPVVIVSDEPFAKVFRRESASAAVIFLGFIPPEPETSAEVYSASCALTAGMPVTFLTFSAGDSSISS